MAYNVSRKGCFKCGNRASKNFFIDLSPHPYLHFSSSTIPFLPHFLSSPGLMVCYNDSRPHSRELYVSGAALLQLP
jgi:hypothetical protein